MIASFGDIGALNGGMWHFDFEESAIGACKAIFPESEVSGCVFHFTKAIHAHLKDVDHLEPAYFFG